MFYCCFTQCELLSLKMNSQQHLVLVHSLKIASNGEECVYQSQPSTAEELKVCLQRSVSLKTDVYMY